MDKIEKSYKPLIIIGVILVAFTILMIIFYQAPSDNGETELGGNEFLRNYEVNEAIPISVNEEKMAKIYLAEYITLLFEDSQKAYELLDNDYRVKKYPTYESFMEYINLIKGEQLSKKTLLKYSIKSAQGYRIYNLYDIGNHNFIFKEKSIMNYSVMLDNYTI